MPISFGPDGEPDFRHLRPVLPEEKPVVEVGEELASGSVVDELAARFRKLQADRAVAPDSDPMAAAVPKKFIEHIRLTPKICGVEPPEAPEV